MNCAIWVSITGAVWIDVFRTAAVGAAGTCSYAADHGVLWQRHTMCIFVKSQELQSSFHSALYCCSRQSYMRCPQAGADDFEIGGKKIDIPEKQLKTID